MATELIVLQEKATDPRFAVCYARGAVFRKEGKFYRVEKGKRAQAHKALCIAAHYGNRCLICPNRPQRLLFGVST